MFRYQLENVCPRQVEFQIIDGKIKDVAFQNGCPGNLLAIATLIDGLPVEEVISKLSGITCGQKATSCSDQLAKVLKKALQEGQTK